VLPKIRGKFFSANFYVKFGHFSGKNHVKLGQFINFSDIFFGQKCRVPLKLTELLRLDVYCAQSFRRLRLRNE